MSLRVVALCAATFAVASFVIPADVAHARKQCRPGGHLHHATSDPMVSKRDAMRNAKSAWFNFTALEYGNRWARFKNARLKRASCHNGQDGWICSIEGNPCKGRLRRTARRK